LVVQQLIKHTVPFSQLVSEIRVRENIQFAGTDQRISDSLAEIHCFWHEQRKYRLIQREFVRAPFALPAAIQKAFDGPKVVQVPGIVSRNVAFMIFIFGA